MSRRSVSAVFLICAATLPTICDAVGVDSSVSSTSSNFSQNQTNAQNDYHYGQTDSKTSGMWYGLTLRIGHHDNYTEVNSSPFPALKSTGFNVSPLVEVGYFNRNLYTSFYFGLDLPIPPYYEKDGLAYENHVLRWGISQRIRIFPRSSNINLTPMLGREWRDEYGAIQVQDNSQPDLLDKHLGEQGIIAGLELKISPSMVRGALGEFIFEYTHYFYKAEINKYKFAIEVVRTRPRINEENSGDRTGKVGSVHMGIELEKRPDGRTDWYIILFSGILEVPYW